MITARCVRCLDALGNALDVESDSAKRKARGQLPYNEALRNVAASMAWHPLTNVDTWVRQSNKAYMASKHVDRPEVSGREMPFAHVATVMMLHAWLAQQLGVAQDRFNRGVAADSLGRVLCDQQATAT